MKTHYAEFSSRRAQRGPFAFAAFTTGMTEQQIQTEIGAQLKLGLTPEQGRTSGSCGRRRAGGAGREHRLRIAAVGGGRRGGDCRCSARFGSSDCNPRNAGPAAVGGLGSGAGCGRPCRCPRRTRRQQSRGGDAGGRQIPRARLRQRLRQSRRAGWGDSGSGEPGRASERNRNDRGVAAATGQTVAAVQQSAAASTSQANQAVQQANASTCRRPTRLSHRCRLPRRPDGGASGPSGSDPHPRGGDTRYGGGGTASDS